jgi:hypothetical protein
MRRVGVSTRARAWFLRTFRGRSASDAGWEDEPVAAVTSPPRTFVLGELEVAATPKGIRAAGSAAPSAVYEVRISIPGDARSWSSRYGLPPEANSAAAAAEIALDELDQIWRDPDAWKAQALAGMSEEEIEAMEDSPLVRLDFKAVEWIGPELDAVRGATKDARGSWL